MGEHCTVQRTATLVVLIHVHVYTHEDSFTLYMWVTLPFFRSVFLKLRVLCYICTCRSRSISGCSRSSLTMSMYPQVAATESGEEPRSFLALTSAPPSTSSLAAALLLLGAWNTCICLTLLASFFLPSHISFKNMYVMPCTCIHVCDMYTCICTHLSLSVVPLHVTAEVKSCLLILILQT